MDSIVVAHLLGIKTCLTGSLKIFEGLPGTQKIGLATTLWIVPSNDPYIQVSCKLYNVTHTV